MTLTTPATASAPYRAEPPSVSISRRSVITMGMALISTNSPPVVVAAAKGVVRLPLINTKVEFSPRFRRLTCAVPSTCERSPEPELVNEPEFTSRFLMTSQMMAAPCASILLRSTIWTGDGASSGVPRMNEPVTMTSSISMSS